MTANFQPLNEDIQVLSLVTSSSAISGTPGNDFSIRPRHLLSGNLELQ
jgi:hypothetical protein